MCNLKSSSLVVFFLLLVCTVGAQQKVSILGDSYSTFYGYVEPDTNLCWYGVADSFVHRLACVACGE